MKRFRGFAKILLMLITSVAVVNLAPPVNFPGEPVSDRFPQKADSSPENSPESSLESSPESEEYNVADNQYYRQYGTDDSKHDMYQPWEDKVRGDFGNKGLFLTADEIKSLENISLADKLTGITILGKIGRNDVDRIYHMAGGGITYDEMEEIKEIFEKSLTLRQIEKLNDILIRNKRLYAEGRLARK